MVNGAYDSMGINSSTLGNIGVPGGRASITSFTLDPIASSLQTNADNAKALGFLDSSDLGHIFDLTAVNKVLKARSQPEVSS